MHIAWQRMSGTFAALPFSSANLKHLTDRLSGSWSIVDEEELSRFLDFYKERRIVEPFKDHESWLQVSKFIDEVSREPMDTKLFHAAKGCEQSVREEKGIELMESAFQGALKMISDIFGSFALLMREDSRKAVTEVCGRMTRRPVVLQQIGAFDWKDERWSRIAHWLAFLSDDFAVNEFPVAFKNIDLSRCCLGAELMSNVWRSLHFDASLRVVTLVEFGDFASQRDRFSFLLWKLAPHLGGLNEIIRQRLTSVLSHLGALISNDEPSGCIDASTSIQSLTKQLLPTGLALMRLATPVSNMVDPVINEEHTYLYLKRKLDLINTQLSIVQRYQSVVSGQDALMLYAKSRHPLIAALITSHRKITDEMNAYVEKLRGFRPSYNDFTRVALEMSSFLRMTIEWCGNVSVEFNGWENRSCEQLEMKKAQFESFLVSAITFCNHVSNEYSAYPDVVQPFLLGVRAIMLSISYLRSEIAAVMNVRRLMFEYSIPPAFKLELDVYAKNEQLLNWCFSEKSIMPKRLQLSLVYSGIRQSGNMAIVHLCTSWIEREWSKWYEKNTQREEKSFVYRKSGKNSEPVDEEDLEVMEMFPDYSSWSEEGVEEVPIKGEGNAVREELLGEEELANLLREFLQLRNGDLGDTYLPLMWLIDATAGSFTIDINVDSALIVSHLMVLKNLGESAHERVIDVYKANSPKELLRCVEAINKLNGRLEALREEWPEMTVIGDILQVSERILKSAATLSQMQLAALLERLLGEAEHWEKVADRKHSISNELNVLREILVDWRKMEVLCWSELLQRVQRCCGDEALLIAWPLFDALKNTERRNEDVLAMSIEWIQHSTLLDFEARLISMRLLAKYAHLSSRIDKEQLAKQILSTAAYFDQYSKVILSRFETLKSPIETQLREFVKIVKYNDLNLWSVKLSAQKAHQQLFRIVKQFKLCGNEPIAPLIDDLLPIPGVNDNNTVTWNVEEINDCDEALIKRASQVAREVAERLHAEFSTDALSELLELTVDCDQLVRKEIVYEGEEEEKEKQQARALDERQKAISLLFKRCAEFGIRFRKGLLVDTEEMTATSVTGIVGSDCLLRKLVRQSAASRSTVLKSLHKPNKQLSTHTISRLKGITEFTLKEMLAFNADLSLKDDALSKIHSALRMLRIHAGNIQDADGECIDHQQWCSSLRLIKLESLEKLRLLVNIMISKLECAPREQYTEYSEIYEISGLTDTPLSKLHTQDPQYSVVKNRLECARSTIERMMRAVDDALATCEGCEEIVVWKRDEICALSDLLHMEGESLCSDFVELTQWMNDECVEAIALTQRVVNLSHFTLVDIGEEHSKDHCHPSLESLLLALQYAYKRTLNIATAGNENSQVTVQVLDRMRSIMSIARSANLEKSMDVLWALCSHISRGCTLKEDLEKAISLTSSLLNVFHLLVNGVERFVLQFALHYLHFESIAVQLLQKGYVNAIPKLEEQNEGQGGKLMASDEPAGMGDAQGDHDVGDEMDEMGQIEGLKGENENEGEKSERREDEDKPIDVDDDFAADLEGIDKDERNEESGDEGEEEEEEPQVDDAMGKVEDSEEDKLDPELWDKEEEQCNEPRKELDQGNEGSKEITDQLVAKDDERCEQDREDRREKEDGGEEHDEEMENVDEREGTGEVPEEEMTAEQQKDKEEVEEEKQDEMGDMMAGKKLDDDEVLEDENEQEGLEGDQQDGVEEEEEKLEALEEVKEKDLGDDENGAEETIATQGGGTEHNEGVDDDGEDKREAASVEQEDTHKSGSESIELKQGGRSESKDSSEKMEENKEERKETKEEEENKSEEVCEKILADKSESMEAEDVQERGEETAEDQSEVSYAHMNEDDNGLSEKLIVEKASMEEAKDSRAQVEQLKERNKANRIEQIGDDIIETEDEREEMREEEKEEEGAEKKDTTNQAPIIYTSTNLYELAGVSTTLSDGESTQLLDSDVVAESNTLDEERWSRISESMSVLSAELAENLRMIIEPTIASKLEGDYRSGKRLNMRRLIAYIASDYRKDRIWLRRTKKAQRNYQILIAVDDSASMHDNNMNLMACQSVCVIGTALHQLEVGQLAICKFGSKVKMLSDFSTYADGSLGGRLLTELTFKQDKTDLFNLLNVSRKVLEEARSRERSNQMMIIVSDGRGVLTDGADRIVKALGALHNDQVTVLFVVVDNAEKSIVETKVAEFTTDGQVELVPYMSKFPFPFYMLVRHISSLPVTLADAIRQWFELTVQNT
uniref:Midasin n=1 Tax=Ascaris suum TaxID=6253 RepID=F1KPX6_ASCSU